MVLMLAASEVDLLVLGCRAAELKAALIPALMEERVAEEAIIQKLYQAFKLPFDKAGGHVRGHGNKADDGL